MEEEKDYHINYQDIKDWIDNSHFMKRIKYNSEKKLQEMNKNSISFIISRSRNYYSYSILINDVEDTIRRLITYMSMEGYKNYEIRKSPNVRTSIDITDKFDDNRKFSPRNKEKLYINLNFWK